MTVERYEHAIVRALVALNVNSAAIPAPEELVA